jgi:hypothetical protein
LPINSPAAPHSHIKAIFLLWFSVLAVWEMSDRDRLERAVFQRAEERRCAVSRNQSSPRRPQNAVTPIFRWVCLGCRFAGCLGFAFSARPCHNTLCDHVALHLGLNHFVRYSTTPQHAIFWGFSLLVVRGMLGRGFLNHAV